MNRLCCADAVVLLVDAEEADDDRMLTIVDLDDQPETVAEDVKDYPLTVLFEDDGASCLDT